MSNSPANVQDKAELQALAATESHPLQKEATGWPYCASDVYEESKKFIDRLRLSDEERSSIQSALSEVETVLVVSYWTAERKPEPMCGGGKHYTFFVHPRSFAVLHAGVGTWRA